MRSAGMPRAKSAKVYWTRKAKNSGPGKRKALTKRVEVVHSEGKIDWGAVKVALIFIYIIIFCFLLLIKKFFF